MSGDEKKVGVYFKTREKVKELMRNMLKPRAQWTKQVKEEFEKTWNDYSKAYDEHERLCKKKVMDS